jgi:hypothetical protein
MQLDQKEQVNNLKVEWKKLWLERMDDKVRAESVAVNDYTSLFVEKGTIIHATRDFKVLNFKEILEKNQIENSDRYIQPDPHVGGWGKFVKNNIAKPLKRKNDEVSKVTNGNGKVQQPKKGGRGWLHK